MRDSGESAHSRPRHLHGPAPLRIRSGPERNGGTLALLRDTCLDQIARLGEVRNILPVGAASSFSALLTTINV